MEKLTTYTIGDIPESISLCIGWSNGVGGEGSLHSRPRLGGWLGILGGLWLALRGHTQLLATLDYMMTSVLVYTAYAEMELVKKN